MESDLGKLVVQLLTCLKAPDCGKGFDNQQRFPVSFLLLNSRRVAGPCDVCKLFLHSCYVVVDVQPSVSLSSV